MTLTQHRFDKTYLLACLQSIFQQPVRDVAWVALEGDASTRRYFRLTPVAADGDPPPPLILMQMEDPVPGEHNDFTRVHRFLQDLGLPVPRIHHCDLPKGFLILEDCGDQTLEAALATADSDQRARWYRQAVDLLVDLQERATRAIGPECPAYSLRFDVPKLMWEMDFMLEHFVAGLLGTNLSVAQRTAVRDPLKELCATLAAQPVWFTHRDYHSRNLMVHNGGLVLLDFQDARMGPCQYDLASLLRDSYVVLPEDLVTELMERFIARKEKQSGDSIDRVQFHYLFDLMAIQRNLKAVGTFAFQTVVRGNERYRPYIAPTLVYVKNTLARRPELGPLRAGLATVIPELAGGPPAH